MISVFTLQSLSANAYEINILEPESTFGAREIPISQPISLSVANQLSVRRFVFKFEGTECVIGRLSKCRVISSQNPKFPIGFAFNAKMISNNLIIRPSSYMSSCSWCPFVSDILSISLFIYFAPVSAPSAILISTYTAGAGIFLGHL
jgi:hypothetical protein